MIAYARARGILRREADLAGAFAAETVPLEEALGRFAARPVFGREPLPRFDNSAMDGFALSSRRTSRASSARPARLELSGTIFAGVPEGRRRPIRSSGADAFEIMTGAPLPPGCDAVVPVEWARRVDGHVEVPAPARPGDFVRRAGTDFKAGALALRAGTRIEPRHLLALAALGVDRVPVRRRPKVALIATGAELVAPGRPARPGQIHDATGGYLRAALSAAGVSFAGSWSVGDRPADFIKALLQARKDGADAILSTGAVSTGRRDFVPAALAAAGAETLFHKVAIKPGKPILAARLGRTFFLGLPGNPVSTAVGWRFFLWPYLSRRLGIPDEHPRRIPLARDTAKPAGLRCFFKAILTARGAEILPGQASFQIRPLLEADAWAVLPERGGRTPAGTSVEVRPLEPGGSA